MNELSGLDGLFIMRHGPCLKDRLTAEGKELLKKPISQIKSLLNPEYKLGIITSHARPTIDTALHVADSLDPEDLVQGRVLLTCPELRQGDFSDEEYKVVLSTINQFLQAQYLVVGHMESAAFLANRVLQTLGKPLPPKRLEFEKGEGIYIPIHSGDYQLIG